MQVAMITNFMRERKLYRRIEVPLPIISYPLSLKDGENANGMTVLLSLPKVANFLFGLTNVRHRGGDMALRRWPTYQRHPHIYPM
jgi:hypothetical protein